MITLGRPLSKLTILAYLDRELKQQVGGMEVAYNPASINLSYSTRYGQNEFINDSKQSSRYQQALPAALELELLFDAQLPGNNKPIDEQIANLRSLCCAIDARSVETRFLKISWGKMQWHGKGYFAGRMSSTSVNYTLFDRNATPLRASVRLTLAADESLLLQASENGIALPQISVVTVPDMSNLASIAAGAQMLVGMSDYGISLVNYLDVAFANDLDNLDDFEAGDSLVGRSDADDANSPSP